MTDAEQPLPPQDVSDAHDTHDTPDTAPAFDDDWPEDHRSGVAAIVGRPNVGKSTLVNQLVGQKIAIVTPKPQTTRRQQIGVLTRPDAQLLLLDTPGFHEPHHKLGEYMVRVVEGALRNVDAILWVVDGATDPHEDDQRIAARIQATRRDTPVVLALNKADLVSAAEQPVRAEAYGALATPDAALWLSALQGDGVAALLDDLVARLPLGPRYYPADQVSEANLRFMASEVIREKVLLNTAQEIPYATAVEIDTFTENADGSMTIHATLYVERDSQKGIVVGKGGTMIKTLGTQARQEMIAMFDVPVQLFLHVKVQPNWRTDEQQMRRFGYGLPRERAGAARRKPRR